MRAKVVTVTDFCFELFNLVTVICCLTDIVFGLISWRITYFHLSLHIVLAHSGVDTL